MTEFSYKGANERFLQMEDTLNLFDIHIDGIPIWERVRNQVSNQIVADLGFVSTPNELGGGRDSPDLRTCVQNSLLRNPFFFTGDQNVLLYSHGRRKLLSDGYWWDIVIDPIAEHLDLPFLCIENYGDSAHPSPAKTPNLRYKDVISCVTGLGKRLSGVWDPLDASSRRRIREVEYEILDVFGVSLDLISKIEEETIARRIRLTLYRLLFDRLGPDVVVVWTRPHTLVEAAQSLDIPVVELQHGMIYRYNFDYHFPADRESHTFPDYLFTFGEYWCDAVDYPIPDERVRPTGYAYAEMVRDLYRDEPKKTDEIVFISQPYVGEKLSQFAVKCATLVNDRTITYKLHPREYDGWQDRYPWLTESDVEVINSDEPELYELLARGDAQVGVSSTALYEGALFDTETYLVNLPRVSTMEYFLDKGVPVVESPRDLLKLIASEAGAVADVEPLFAPDAAETTASSIQRVATSGSFQ